MPITFDEPSAASVPSIKLRTAGANVVFHIVDIEEIPVYDDDGNRKVSARGWEHVQKRITGVLKSHSDGTDAGTQAEPAEPVDGQVYAFYTRVQGFFAWKEAVAEHVTNTGKQVTVGDVVKWTLDKIDKPTKPTQSGRHETSFAIRAAKPEEAAEVARCEAIYAERKAGPALTDEAPSYSEEEMDPF